VPVSPYTCCFCRRRFLRTWSDEEAIAALERELPGASQSPLEIYCSDCYRKVTGLYPIQQYLRDNAE
jgi:hypothetical protein